MKQLIKNIPSKVVGFCFLDNILQSTVSVVLEKIIYFVMWLFLGQNMMFTSFRMMVLKLHLL